jgi:hypothetical protein
LERPHAELDLGVLEGRSFSCVRHPGFHILTIASAMDIVHTPNHPLSCPASNVVHPARRASSHAKRLFLEAVNTLY